MFQGGFLKDASGVDAALYPLAVAAGFAERMLTSAVAAVAGDSN